MNKISNELLQGYENTRLYRYNDIAEELPNSVWYDELSKTEVTGVLKANRYVNGRLLQTYSEKENHIGIIAGTRLGKTSSYVIPTVVSFAKAANKRSMIISDPKGEIYRHTAATLKEEGYRVLLLNFRDYLHSECWNPLTPIFWKYQHIFDIYDEVEVVQTDKGPRNKFHREIYENQKELDEEIERWMSLMTEDVGNDIDNVAMIIAPTFSTRDPYWEDSARELLKAYLWAMLEDSRPENLKNEYGNDSGRQLITEDTFSFATIITLMSALCGGSDDFSCDYFQARPATSRAYQIVKTTVPDRAQTTRQCIFSAFTVKMSVFRESAMRIVTSCNSFDLKEILTGNQPVALFIDYRDELKVHYKVISMFVQDAYRLLIEHANSQPDGKREVPFYFVLDEFGNFPKINDFETTISACAGRNIFFILVIQSYAQLNGVYGEACAAVIRDNLNMHVFFGSNNTKTLEEFSAECGKFTRVSPRSVLNGNGVEMDNYILETISLVPISMLAHFSPGECIITEANCGYVMLSRMERYYLCKEFSDLPLESEQSYACAVDPLSSRYVYKIRSNKPGKNGPFHFDF